MEDVPTISVVIPSYNAARWVAESVESALAQTHKPSQIIVVDDGSTDETEKVLGPLRSRGIQYVRQPNRGVAAARNAGVATSNGQFIAFLDADDIWHPKKLELQCALMLQRPELGVLGTSTFAWPGTLPELGQSADEEYEVEVPWAKLIVRNYFTTSSIMVTRDALDQIGSTPFDETLRGPEDFDLWLRIAECRPVANLPLRLTGYREVPGSLGKQATTMEAGVGRILSKAGERGVWNRKCGSLLRRKAYAYFYYKCGYMHGVAGHQSIAAARVLRSMATYPLPLSRREAATAFARPKLLAVSVLRCVGLKSPERQA